MNEKIIYKLLVCISVVTIFFSIEPAQSQWRRVKNLPYGYSEKEDASYLDVFFLPNDPNYGWVCGHGGRIVATTDGGLTWKGSTINTADQMESIDFVDKNNGYVVDATESAIYKTTDGGKTWKNISPPGLRPEFWGTYFYSAKLGVLMGGSTCIGGLCRFYRTTDGGATWDQTTDASIGRPTKPSDAIILDATGRGYAVSSGLIWATDDALHWRVIDQTGADDWHEEITYDNGSFLVPVSQSCVGSTDLGYGGMRFKEGGTNYWRNFNTGVPMFGTALLDKKTGWAVGFDRAVYYTSDAGKNWELKNCGVLANVNLDDIYFANDTTGWLVGQGIYQWVPVDTTKPEIIVKSPVCPDEKGYVKIKNSGNYEKLDWYINGKFYTSFYDSISVSPGTYVSIYYEDWDKPQCGQLDSILIKAYPKSTVTILHADSLNLCANDSLKLEVKEDYPKYLWSNGDTTKTTIVKQPGTYTVFIEDKNGCQYAQSCEVKSVGNPQGTIELLGNNIICNKDSVQLKLRGDYKESKWYIDEEKDENYISDKNQITVKKQGNYFAVLKSKYGCENSSDTIFVEVKLDSNRFEYKFSTGNIVEQMGDSKYPELLCRELTVYNITNNYEDLTTAYFKKNISFSVPPGQLPQTLDPNGNYNLQVCYTSYNLPLERDTLLIFDHCGIHEVPMVAEATGEVNNGRSNCEIYIETAPKEIDKSFRAYFDRPYPNPAFEDVYLDVIGKIQDIMEADISVCDYMGNKVSYEKSFFNATNQSATVKLSIKTGNGSYFVKIAQGGKIVVYPIIILK